MFTKKILHMICFVFCFAVCIPSHSFAEMKVIPDVRGTNITAFSETTPDEFCRRFNQIVTEQQAGQWFYVGTPQWQSNGDIIVRNNTKQAGEGSLRIFLSTDYNGYINYISVRVPVHQDVCTGKWKDIFAKEISYALMAVLPGKYNSGIGYTILENVGALRANYTTRYDGAGNRVMVLRRMTTTPSGYSLYTHVDCFHIL